MTTGTSWLDTLGQIFHVIPDLATPEQVEASMREILDDPTLELFWWDWKRETYVDVREGNLGVVVSAPGRVVTLVEYESRKVGAVAHDERLLETPVCAEAVTNTVKHARASKVWLDIAHEGGMLRVEVRDDGIGGACINCDGDATGLGGLKDRVEALGGVLELVSPAGEGTRLLAAFPVAEALAEEPGVNP